MRRSIVALDEDAKGEWVATLSCGHRQHVRHRPPFDLRPWVLTEEARRAKLGTPRDCPLCDELGGESACYAHVICEECGVVLDGAPHAAGCGAARSPHHPSR